MTDCVSIILYQGMSKQAAMLVTSKCNQMMAMEITLFGTRMNFLQKSILVL